MAKIKVPARQYRCPSEVACHSDHMRHMREADEFLATERPKSAVIHLGHGLLKRVRHA